MDAEKQKRIAEAEESIRKYFEINFPDKHNPKRKARLMRKMDLEEKRLKLSGLGFIGDNK